MAAAVDLRTCSLPKAQPGLPIRRIRRSSWICPPKDGELQPAVAAKWVANSPLAMVDQYIPNLKKYHAIAMEVGLQDGLATSNQELDQALSRFDVVHTFETYEGDHTNRVKKRFETKVLPFFSNNLTFPLARKAKRK